jgi:hypothetical protein
MQAKESNINKHYVSKHLHEVNTLAFKTLTIPTPALSVSGIKGKNSQQLRQLLISASYCTPWFGRHTNNFLTNVQKIVVIYCLVFA